MVYLTPQIHYSLMMKKNQKNAKQHGSGMMELPELVIKIGFQHYGQGVNSGVGR
jgi:hypothetical protein